MGRQTQNIAYIYAISAVLLWSTIATAFKLTLQYLDFISLLFYASFFSLLSLAVLLAFQKKFNHLKKIKLKELYRPAIRGLINPFVYYLSLLKAYELLKAQEAGTLNYFWPVTLVLLSIPMLGQKISFKSIAAILVSFAGIWTISTEGRIASFEFREPLGIILILGGSVLWSLYWILNMKDKNDVGIKLFLNFCFGCIYILIFKLIVDGIVIPPWQGIVGAAYVGFFEMGITFFLWLKAMGYSTTSARISNLVYLSPFISLLIINRILGEKIVPATWIGLVLIVGGIILQHYFSRQSRSLPKTHP